MTSNLRIAVFTGSRSEYGLLRYLINRIHLSSCLTLQLIVSGTHLSKNYGLTVTEIENNAIPITARIYLDLDSVAMPSMGELTGQALIKISQTLRELTPDYLILLGDRYETFAAAASAHLLGINVIHLHGGESTEGAVDDRLRHSITQLSTWHFTSAESYRLRVIQMGHSSECVFNVGPMALDGFYHANIGDRRSFETQTGFRFGERNLLVTYHPETLLADYGMEGFRALLNAIDSVSCNVLFTHPNADTGSRELLSELQGYVSENSLRCWSCPSLGHQLYLSALHLFDAMAGNSSSGVIEAPLVAMPVLNIGRRQLGRIKYESCIDILDDYNLIPDKLEFILNAGYHQSKPRSVADEFQSPSRFILNWIEGHLTS